MNSIHNDINQIVDPCAAPDAGLSFSILCRIQDTTMAWKVCPANLW